MKAPNFLFAATLLAFSISSQAGEFKDECAWGLANDKHVATDCKVNALGKDGKTYCFSSESARTSFMKDPIVNAKKAGEVFGRS